MERIFSNVFFYLFYQCSNNVLYVCNNLCTGKISYDAYADALSVISRCVRANVIPSATLVGVAIFANDEIIANIPPAPIIYVKVLIGPNYRGTCFFVVTVSAYAAVMDHHIRRRCHWQKLKI